MKGIVRSLLVGLWFMVLTFPLVVIKVNPAAGEVVWRWRNMFLIGAGIFVLSFVWRGMLVRKGIMTADEAGMTGLLDFLAAPKRREQAVAFGFFLLGLLPLTMGLSGPIDGTGPYELPSPPALAVSGLCLVAAVICLCGKRKSAAGALQAGAGTLARPGAPRVIFFALGLLALCLFPFAVDVYQVNVLTQAFIWIMLGLGLNIVVGQAGLLVLGYVAFYAVGAYTYALGHQMFGNSYIGFWLFLPLAGLFACAAGVLLSLPVLRLRGDYLAIVTLGFGEIVRAVLESGSLSLSPLAALYELFSRGPAPVWMTTPLDFGGPAGIGGIPHPGFFGVSLGMDAGIRSIYFVSLGMALLTILAVGRLRDSRLGRSWMALREDEIACEAMGVNKVAAKLSAFALGACWAGFGGVLFAAKTSFINPTSFTFMESALILSVVVLGGLDSILGVILGSCVLIILPEYLRAFDEYRMLIFGAGMVLMMVFRPQGLIMPKAKKRLLGPDAPSGTRLGSRTVQGSGS